MKICKAETGGTKKNKVDVSFALLFSSNHIKIKKAPSETAKICHDIAKIKLFEKTIKKSSKQRVTKNEKMKHLMLVKNYYQTRINLILFFYDNSK